MHATKPHIGYAEGDQKSRLINAYRKMQIKFGCCFYDQPNEKRKARKSPTECWTKWWSSMGLGPLLMATRMQLLSEYGVYASQVPTTSPAVAGVTGAVCPAIPLTVGRTPRTALWLWGAGDGDPDMWFRSPTFCVAGKQYYYRLFIPESLATLRALAQAAQPATAATALAAALVAASAVAGRGRGGDAPRRAAAAGRRAAPSMSTYLRSPSCWWNGYKCFWCDTEQAWAYQGHDEVLRWWLD